MNLKHVVKPMIAACAALFLLGGAPRAQAATFTVTNTADSGAGSLRQAITDAAVGDTINFASGVTGTIFLNTGELAISKSLTIIGPGAPILALSGLNEGRIFNISAGTVAIFDLTLQNGRVASGKGAAGATGAHGTSSSPTGNSGGAGGVGGNARGGAVFNAGTLTLSNVVVKNSVVVGGMGGTGGKGGTGGYFYNDGINPIIKPGAGGRGGNGGNGGAGMGSGLCNTGTCNIINCTFNSNTSNQGDGGAGGAGGTAFNPFGTHYPNGSAGSSGSAGAGAGGALYNSGTLTISNCTLSDNYAAMGGGFYNSGTATVDSCTISGNSANQGGGFYRNNGSIALNNSIVAGNSANFSGPDIYGAASGNYNLVQNTSGAALSGLNLTGVDPKLGTLADNGGPTPTMALLTGSPAIDAGSTALTTDQRGIARPQGSADDIGAYEVGSLTPTISINNPRSLPEGSAASPGSVTFDITLNNPATQPVTVNYQTSNGTNNPATAGVDYREKHGKLTFAPGETLKRVTIFFIGDNNVELNETFFFDLSAATNATIADGRGVGQINNDDGPGISINNTAAFENVVLQTFTVTLSATSTDTVTVNWTTADNTAKAGEDYIAANGVLTFAPGETSKDLTVQINNDSTVEAAETYKVVLSKATYGFISDGTGIGTIRNDDGSTQALQSDQPSQ